MKWIIVLLCVLAVLFVITNGRAEASHHETTHYKGWTAPDSWCSHHSDSYHLRNCVKAQRVVYKTFPRSTEQDAMQVASCETGDTFDRWATNSSSGTAGLFQLHPGNVGRFVKWGDRHIVISRQLYNSWVNAKAALFLSRGGKDWGEWAGVCQP